MACGNKRPSRLSRRRMVRVAATYTDEHSKSDVRTMAFIWEGYLSSFSIGRTASEFKKARVKDMSRWKLNQVMPYNLGN